MIAKAGPVKGAGRGGQLGHDLFAVPALLDHPDHAGDLALGPAEPVQDRLELRTREIQFHSRSSQMPRGSLGPRSGFFRSPG